MVSEYEEAQLASEGESRRNRLHATGDYEEQVYEVD